MLRYKIYEPIISQSSKTTLPLLMLCGTGSIQSDYTSMATYLSKERTIVTVDYLNMESSNVDITLVQTSTKVFSVLEHLGIHDFYILGHSFGGLIALQLTLLLRGRDDFKCHGILLLSTSARINRNSQVCRTVHDTIKHARLNITGNDGNLNSQQQSAFDRSFIDACIAPSKKHSLILEFDHARNIINIQQQMDALDANDLVEQLHLINNVPLLSLFGLKDQTIDVIYAQAIVENFSNASLVPIPDLGHWGWLVDNRIQEHCELFLYKLDSISSKL